jgi:translation elongation factor EF-G
MRLPLCQLITEPAAESQESAARNLVPLVLPSERIFAEVTKDGLVLHATSELDLELAVDNLRADSRQLALGKPQIQYIQADVWQEPYASLILKIPKECLAEVRGDLQARRAEVQEIEAFSPELATLRAIAPMSELFGYTTCLRSLTRGRGSYEQAFLEYRPFPRF